MALDQQGQNRAQAEMSFLEHLEELRWHIIRSLVAIVAIGIVLYIFNNWVFEYVIYGPTREDFISYKLFCQLSNAIGLGDAMCIQPIEFQSIAVELGEPFIMSIKVSFIGGFIVAFPYIFYEFWSFIKPGLYPEERRLTRGFVFVVSFLFMLGVAFGYYIIAPFAVNFLGGVTIPGVTNTPTLKSVINYMLLFTAPTGLVFELPVLVYVLSRIGLLTADTMRAYRRHAVIGTLLLAALITPPDVITQFLIGIPLFILYEMSIYISARVNRIEEKKMNS